jgi:hypothetical protein
MSNPSPYFNSSPEVIRLVVMMYVRYPSLQTKTLGRVGGVARTRGVDRRLRAGMSRHAQTTAVTLMVWTTPAPASARSELCQDGCR